jgi:outer membrane receptor for ferrienterochelin and colicins
MIKLAIPLLMFLLYGYIQSATIDGRVIDKYSGKALAGANVYIKDTSFGSSSDSDGYFSFDVTNAQKGDYKLVTTYIGYYDKIIDISLPLNINIFTIRLKESMLLMDQIVITGTREERFLKDSPVTTQVINSKQIEEKGANNVGDLLSEATGIVIEQDSRFGNMVTLQGFDSNHILFLVNGIKVIGRLNGQFDISQLSASDIERIEVLKGPTSALYGSQAMGGVINIITKRPIDDFQITVNSKFGSYNRINSDLNISYPIAAWKSKINIGTRHFGGYDLDEQTELQDRRTFNKLNSDLQFDGKISQEVKLNLSASYFKEEQSRILNTIFSEKIDNERYSARIGANIDSLFPFAIESNFSYEHYDHNYSEIVRSSGYVKSADPTKNDFSQFLTLLNKEWENHLFQFGYSMEYDAINSSRINSGYKKSFLHGIFVSDEYKNGSFFTIQGGARLDIHSIYGQQFSPKLSLMFVPGYTGRLRLSYGHGFRAPSFKELYLTLYVGDVNLSIKGNPLLKPENSNSLSLDYEFWNTDNYHVHTNLYYNRVKDLISDIRTSGDGSGLYYTYHNFGQVETWGVEWEMKYFPIDIFEISLGYTYMNSFVQETGDALSGKSHHTARGAILVSLPWKIKINFRTQYFGAKSDTRINEDTGEILDKNNIADYALLNLNISKTFFTHFKLSIGGTNLNDYINRVWGPLPGREIYAELRYRY